MPLFTLRSTPSRTPAHREAQRPRQRFASVGGILTSTALIGGAAFIGIAGVGGTNAQWNGSAKIAAPTINSGSMALAVGSAGSESASYAIPSTAWTALLPGDAVRQQVSVKVNNSPSRVSSGITAKTSATLPTGFELRAVKGVCTSSPLTGTTNLVTPTATSLGTWTAAETAFVCVQVSLRTDAPSSLQGASTGVIAFTLKATQQ